MDFNVSRLIGSLESFDSDQLRAIRDSCEETISQRHKAERLGREARCLPVRWSRHSDAKGQLIRFISPRGKVWHVLYGLKISDDEEKIWLYSQCRRLRLNLSPRELKATGLVRDNEQTPRNYRCASCTNYSPWVSTLEGSQKTIT